MTLDYCLQVIRLEDLRWKHPLHSGITDLYVEVKLGNDARTTRTIKKSRYPVWNESLVFPSSDEFAIFNIHVKHNSSWLTDPRVGSVDINLTDLLRKSVNGEVHLILSSRSWKAHPMPVGRLVLHLQTVERMVGAAMTVKAAGEDVRRYEMARPKRVAEVANSTLDGANLLINRQDLYQAVGQLLSRLEAFKGVIDVASEVHPFLTIAWNVASGLLQSISNVYKTDQKVVSLVRSMEDAFAFIQNVEGLADKARNLRQPIEGLLKQTIECCLFIRQYISQDFIGRILDANSSEKVSEFEDSLADFKQKIKSGTILYTAVVSSRVSQRIDSLLLRQLLNPSLIDAFDRSVCLAGTRLEIQKRVLNWIFSETSQSIFWLHGVAGSGKSTVSMTIAEHLRDMSRLGAYMFFERGKSEPLSVLRTVAYKLALYDSEIASSMLSVLDNDKDITAASSASQFNKLFLHPLLAAARSLIGPVIIVLDALDECGTPESRRSLLQLFKRDFPKLPKCFRFFVTSRREPDIDKVLSSQSDLVCAVELDFTSATSQDDVSLYLHRGVNEAVTEQVEVPREWAWDENIALLCKAAGGLFIWASTAIRMMSVSDDPFGTLEDLVADSSSVAHFGLDQLYASVLRNSGIMWAKETSKARFAKVLGMVLLSKVPLSTRTIDSFLSLSPDQTSLLVLSRLRSVLTYSMEGPVTLFHTSFSDYLMSSDRVNDPWHIDIPRQKHVIAVRCFTVMEDELHFNICDLETSFVRNDEILDLDNRIRKRIPLHLQYACLHWSQHLCDAQYSSDLVDKLSDFAYQRLLFWFEVLSLLKAFRRLASSALLDASAWVKARSLCTTACGTQELRVIKAANEVTSSFLEDASNLVSTFTFPISQSTPHIYISMIPLGRDDSDVAAHYSQRMSHVVQVRQRGVKRPPMWLKLFEGHTGTVNSAVTSSSRNLLASASDDKTVRVWDIGSGEEICAPLTGHLGNVLSVNFSPDEKCIASGSEDGTLRIWNALDGSLSIEPLEGHMKGVRSLAFSHDGKRIASGSDDSTVIIWDAENGYHIAGPLTGHQGQVIALVFMPNDERVVSGSNDSTIRIWNVKTGEPVLETSVDRVKWVMSVALSPDGRHTAFGSSDGTIRIWETERKRLVAGPFREHKRLTSVAYSACGTRIVSGSADKTMIIWDARNGDVISGPLTGLSEAVSSVSFSPDGKYVVSGSYDGTVAIWHSDVHQVCPKPFVGHGDPVRCVAFSADGSRVASASIDKTIMVWNTETAESITGPLEGHTQWTMCFAFSSDNSRLVSGSLDSTVRIWDVESGKMVHNPLDSRLGCVYCVIVTPDDTKIISGTNRGEICVWDMESGNLLFAPRHAHAYRIDSLALSPNGKRLSSCSFDGTAKIWDTETWETVSEPVNIQQHRISLLHFSLDGTKILIGSNNRTSSILDASSGRITAGPFEGHEHWDSRAVLSIDGKHIISSCDSRTIRIRSTENGEPVCEPLEGHTNVVHTLALSRDGRWLASGSADKTVRIWDISAILNPSKERSSSSSSVLSESSSEDFSDWVLGENGWISRRSGRRDLVFWVPPELRATLWRCENRAVFNCEFSTQLDFADAALGERWTECFAP